MSNKEVAIVLYKKHWYVAVVPLGCYQNAVKYGKVFETEQAAVEYSDTLMKTEFGICTYKSLDQDEVRKLVDSIVEYSFSPQSNF
jgi:hypothetical protein